MDKLTQQVKELAIESGADLVGIAAKDRLADTPVSGDPAYLLPDARSVISFAVALDPEAARAFISKEDWLSHGEDRKSAVRTLYIIGERLVSFLDESGFNAVNVEINNRYRPEDRAADVTEMTEFHPDFSHRYGAVAAGIGRLGWSGNLMTHRYGALVELGSVLTSAELADDPVLGENPCDRCKNCSLVCPVQMIGTMESVKIRVAGITEEIAKKRPNTCCWIGCTGYEGTSGNGKWSNWSPYRLDSPLPEDKSELDTLCVRLQKADPQMKMGKNIFNDYRSAVFDPEWFYYTVCGFCRSVCSPIREDRMEKRRNLHRSGTVALNQDGMHVVAQEETTKFETPFGVKVVVPVEDQGQPEVSDEPAGRWPMDREVLSYLAKIRGK
jgi:ferredoxin